jgi:hypothetical protein
MKGKTALSADDEGWTFLSVLKRADGQECPSDIGREHSIVDAARAGIEKFRAVLEKSTGTRAAKTPKARGFAASL